ncbi:hypothetical protein BV283P3_00020 [Phocaeicola phage BV283P3]|nr:hypothetical protein BD166P1_00020 [OM05-12 phage BD166P1]WAX10628.1 hypothetical protein BV283P3_00020 [Phocaeicola phage BV283P3]
MALNPLNGMNLLYITFIFAKVGALVCFVPTLQI